MKSIPVELVPSLNAFLIALNKAYEIYWNRMKFTHSKSPQIRVSTIGQKYAKLCEFDERNGTYTASSVYCFLDLTNGDLHKGTWKAPVAKGKRGNLADADLLKKFDVHGPCYLTGGGYHNNIATELLASLAP